MNGLLLCESNSGKDHAMVSNMLKAILSLLIPVSVLAQREFPMPRQIDAAGFREVVAVSGDLYISGQPDSAAFVWLKADGVTTVINLRTSQEMANRSFVPFDEQVLVEGLGMKFIHIPLGGPDTPYTPEALRKFADTLKAAPGKVLLHCTVAWRASHMFAAYLIRYQGMPPAQAIAYARAVNFSPLPVEGLLGKEMVIDFK